MSDAAPQPPHPAHPWRWPIVCVVLLITIMFVVRECSPARTVERSASAGEKLLDHGLKMWKGLTQAQIQERIGEFIQGLPVAKDTLSLVVTQVDFTQSLYAENNKKMWGIDLGTTRVLVNVPARVHYAIDLMGDKPVHFSVDPQNRVFKATFPDPEVLAVEIFDKDKQTIVDTGWGRLRTGSGDELLHKLDESRYAIIREKAESPQMERMVRERARPVLARFIALYLLKQQAWGGGDNSFTRIEVSFAGDAPKAHPEGYDAHAISLEAP